MKNIIIILFIFSTYNVLGQNQLIGIEGGLSQTNIISKYSQNHTDRNGLSLGLNYEYVIKSLFSIGTGLTYNQRGFKDKVTIVDQNQNFVGESNYKSNFDYMSVPVKVGVIFGRKFFGIAKIGVVSSILTSGKIVMPNINTNGETDGDNSVDISNKIKKLDISALGEIGAGYKLSDKYWLSLSFEYQQGLTSFSTSEFIQGSVKHKVTIFEIGLKYLINGK